MNKKFNMGGLDKLLKQIVTNKGIKATAGTRKIILKLITEYNLPIKTKTTVLANELGVSRITIQRTIKVLEDLGCNVLTSPGRNGFIKIVDLNNITSELDNFTKSETPGSSSNNNIYINIKNYYYRLRGIGYEIDGRKVKVLNKTLMKSFITVLSLSKFVENYNVTSKTFIHVLHEFMKYDALIQLVAFIHFHDQTHRGIRSPIDWLMSRIKSEDFNYELIHENELLNKVVDKAQAAYVISEGDYHDAISQLKLIEVPRLVYELTDSYVSGFNEEKYIKSIKMLYNIARRADELYKVFFEGYDPQLTEHMLKALLKRGDSNENNERI